MAGIDIFIRVFILNNPGGAPLGINQLFTGNYPKLTP
jgi:hypothetical protein